MTLSGTSTVQAEPEGAGHGVNGVTGISKLAAKPSMKFLKISILDIICLGVYLRSVENGRRRERRACPADPPNVKLT